MNIIKKIINKARSRKHPYPIYYQRRTCRKCGAAFSSDNVYLHYEYDKNGEKILSYIVLSCYNRCELHDGERIVWLNWYVNKEDAIRMIDDWFKDDCPILEGGLQ